MARATILVALALLCSVAAVSAQCIACKDCKGSNACLSMCKKECPAPAPPPVTVNLERCKDYGNTAGKDVAKFSCDLTLTYCQANKIQPRSYMPPPRVTLQQCGNAAYGVCQSVTASSASPCYKEFNNGVGACTKAEFRTFFEKIRDEQCNNKVAPFDKPQGRK